MNIWVIFSRFFIVKINESIHSEDVSGLIIRQKHLSDICWNIHRERKWSYSLRRCCWKNNLAGTSEWYHSCFWSFTGRINKSIHSADVVEAEIHLAWTAAMLENSSAEQCQGARSELPVNEFIPAADEAEREGMGTLTFWGASARFRRGIFLGEE